MEQTQELSISEDSSVPWNPLSAEGYQPRGAKVSCKFCTHSFSTKPLLFAHFARFHEGQLLMDNDSNDSSETIGSASHSQADISDLDIDDNEESETLPVECPAPEEICESLLVPTVLSTEASYQPFGDNSALSTLLHRSVPSAVNERSEAGMPSKESRSRISNKKRNGALKTDENYDGNRKYWCKLCDTYWQGLNKLKNHVRDRHHLDPTRITRWNYAIWDLEICRVNI